VFGISAGFCFMKYFDVFIQNFGRAGLDLSLENFVCKFPITENCKSEYYKLE